MLADVAGASLAANKLFANGESGAFLARSARSAGLAILHCGNTVDSSIVVRPVRLTRDKRVAIVFTESY